MSFPNILSSIVLLVPASGLFATDFEVADVLADHMVLQQQETVPVWGWTAPGERVTVEFKGQKVSALANEYGKWAVDLTPLEADAKSADMTISCASGRKRITDILVGEVWICSGQSNMGFHCKDTVRGPELIAVANNPAIRLLKVPHRPEGYPICGLDAEWEACTPASVRLFSGVGHYFGLELFNTLAVPIK